MSFRTTRRSSQGLGFWLLAFAALAAFRVWHSQDSAKQRHRRATQKHFRQTDAPLHADAGEPPATLIGSSSEGNLLLGNPSGAGTDSAKNSDNFLLERAQYSLSFNHSQGEPNWVSWHVDAADLGHVERGKFAPDPDLPATWRITPGDYKGSGYDRGHVCPSGDRTMSRENNDPTFYMSNMLPQSGALNRHVWADLEEYTRGMVHAGKEIYQIAGGLGDAGTIAEGKVRIPAKCWKIIVVLPLGQKDLSRIDSQSRVIAVEMPNEESKTVEHADWHSYRVSVGQIESDTRLKFFSALNGDLAKTLKAKVDNED